MLLFRSGERKRVKTFITVTELLELTALYFWVLIQKALIWSFSCTLDKTMRYSISLVQKISKTQPVKISTSTFSTLLLWLIRRIWKHWPLILISPHLRPNSRLLIKMLSSLLSITLAEFKFLPIKLKRKKNWSQKNLHLLALLFLNIMNTKVKSIWFGLVKSARLRKRIKIVWTPLWKTKLKCVRMTLNGAKPVIEIFSLLRLVQRSKILNLRSTTQICS